MSADKNRKPNPLQALWYRAGYTIDRLLKTGQRRAEFEHKYAAHGDYFGYRTDPYELKKYADTLSCVLEWRRGASAVLEIGCSVGMFTAMLAPHFEKVVASDIAQQALALASAQVGEARNVSFVRGDLLELDLKQKFDIVICAEILMYIRESDGGRVCEVLERHLAPNGLVVEVAPRDRASNAKFFLGWNRVLGAYFHEAFRLVVDDANRPYEIVAYDLRSHAVT